MDRKWSYIGAAVMVVTGAAIAAAVIMAKRTDSRFPVQELSEGPPIPKLTVVHEVDNQLHVRYERDGIPLFAEIYRPRNTTRPRPAVIVVPGGFEGPNYQNRLLCKQLAQRGFLAALPHLRGTGQSGGEITFCLEEGRDVQDLARALTQVGSSGPYCYIGISLGGAISLNAAQNDPDLRGIAHVFSPTDFRQQHSMLKGWKLHDKVKKWEGWIGGSPDSHPEAWAERDPLEFAKSVSAPLLILQAGKDVLVPPRQAANLAKVREEAGRTVHREALGPSGEPWIEPLTGAAQSILPVAARGPYSDDNLLFFAELPHATNEAVLNEVFKAVDAWLVNGPK